MVVGFLVVLFFLGGKAVYRVTNSNFAPLLSGPDKRHDIFA